MVPPLVHSGLKITSIFGQKLPIRTAHNTFLESRQPEVTKNSYTHFLGTSSWTTSENVEKVYEKKTFAKKFIIFQFHL